MRNVSTLGKPVFQVEIWTAPLLVTILTIVITEQYLLKKLSFTLKISMQWLFYKYHYLQLQKEITKKSYRKVREFGTQSQIFRSGANF